MAWGSKTQITNAANISGTSKQSRSTAVTLNPGETAHVQVEANPPTTPTDDLEVYIETTLDDAAENWDDSEYGAPITIVNSIDPNARSFLITGVYKFSLIYACTGGTDTIAVSAWYRKDGVSL